MTNAVIQAALTKYAKLFPTINAAKFDSDSFVPDSQQQGTYYRTLQHLKWMIHEALDMLQKSDDAIDGGRSDVVAHRALTAKAMRWLCFIQGALWVNGYCTINELRADNTEPTSKE